MMKLTRIVYRSLTIILGIVTCQSSFGATNALPTQTFTLNNGLKVIVREDHRAPVVTSQIWYRVGSFDESDGQTGISHVLEHMMFKGTHTHPKDSFAKIIALNGGEENAFTSRDFTGYFETLAKEKLPIAFELEADRMQHASLKTSDFLKEIEVVKEERRIKEDKPEHLTFERFAASAFVANPYRHPTIGWMHDLNNLNVKDVRKWYKTWYGPNNATLIVVGDVEPNNVHKLAKRYFGSIPKTQLPKRRSIHAMETIGERHVNVKAPAKVPFVIRGYNVPNIQDPKDYEPYALKLLAYVLGGAKSSRMPTLMVRRDQLAAYASAHYDPIGRAPTVFTFSAAPTPKHDVASLSKAFDTLVKQLQEKPIEKDELLRAKTKLRAEYIFAKDSIQHQAYEIGEFEMAGLPWQTADDFIRAIDKITPTQIQEVAQKYLTPNRLTQAVLLPQSLKFTNAKGVKHG